MSSPVKASLAVSTLIAATLALSALLPGSCAAADAWPNRPVRFIVTLGPGSGVDIGARLFADKLSARWGQPVVVENRPGGDGMVAITSFLSAHDDHTLLVSPVSSFTAHPYFHDKLPYDPQDLIPIARISKTVVAVSVPDLAERQFAERVGGTRPRQTRPVELDHRHRLYRFRLRRISAHRWTQDGESAL